MMDKLIEFGLALKIMMLISSTSGGGNPLASEWDKPPGQLLREWIDSRPTTPPNIVLGEE